MNESIRVLTVEDMELWKQLYSDSEPKDIHLDPDYITLFDRPIDGTPLLFISKFPKGEVYYPFYKRDFKVLIGGKDLTFTDVISPWLYGGFHYTSDITATEIHETALRFRKYASSNSFISHFSRFNPYHGFPVENVLGDIQEVGRVFPIDLTPGMERIYKESMKPSCLRAVRRSFKIGLRIRISNDMENIRSFHGLYESSMDRKHARSVYHFGLDFQLRMAKRFPDRFLIINAYLDDRIVSGSAFLISNGIIYYFLSARDVEIDDNCSMNRLMMEAMRYGVDAGLQTFDLGGGNRIEGLERFKSSFTPLVKPFFARKVIYDRPRYTELCKVAGIDSQPEYENAEFFPEYRKTINTNKEE
jgi:hypothetical protein